MPRLSLPVFKTPEAADPAALLRIANHAEELFSATLAETLPLDCGTGYASAEFPLLPEANTVYLTESAAPDPASTADEITTAFAPHNTTCRQLILPPSQLNQLNQFIQFFPSHRPATDTLLRMTTPTFPQNDPPVLTIIPGRSSFAALRCLAESTEGAWGTTNADLLAQCAASADRFLDDPRIDNLLALDTSNPAADPTPVGTLYLATVGESLLVYNLYVHPAHARRGIATALLAHATDLAARSRARHLLLFCEDSNAPARALYQKTGFLPIARRGLLALPDPA